MATEYGQWTVDINEDEVAIIVEFSHMSENGVETFTTGMPAGPALEFAEALRLKAEEVIARG